LRAGSIMRLLEDHAETAHATSVRLRQFESGCRGRKAGVCQQASQSQNPSILRDWSRFPDVHTGGRASRVDPMVALRYR
jgi:hypothetical protein